MNLILCGVHMGFFCHTLHDFTSSLHQIFFCCTEITYFLAVCSCNSPFALDQWNISHVGALCKDVRKFSVWV